MHLGLRLIEERAGSLAADARAELLHAVACHHDLRAARTAEAAALYHANQLDAVAATRPVDQRVTAIGLAFAASVLWGVGDFFGGLTSRRLATLAVVAISQLFGFGGILVVAAFGGGDFPGLTAVAAAMAAGLAGAIGLAGLYRGMAIGAMGVVAPISASAAVIPVTVGLARGERPSALQLAGVALALFGVVLVSREPGAEWRLSAGVPLALVAALGFGGYFVFMDRASADDAYWAVVVARGFSSAIALAVAAAWGTLRVGRSNLPVLVAHRPVRCRGQPRVGARVERGLRQPRLRRRVAVPGRHRPAGGRRAARATGEVAGARRRGCTHRCRPDRGGCLRCRSTS